MLEYLMKLLAYRLTRHLAQVLPGRTYLCMENQIVFTQLNTIMVAMILSSIHYFFPLGDYGWHLGLKKVG